MTWLLNRLDVMQGIKISGHVEPDFEKVREAFVEKPAKLEKAPVPIG